MVEASAKISYEQIYDEYQRLIGQNPFVLEWSDQWFDTKAPVQVLLTVALQYLSEVDHSNITEKFDYVMKFAQQLIVAKNKADPNDCYKNQIMGVILSETIGFVRWYNVLKENSSSAEAMAPFLKAYLKTGRCTDPAQKGQPFSVYCGDCSILFGNDLVTPNDLFRTPFSVQAIRHFFDAIAKQQVAIFAAGDPGLGKTELHKEVGKRIGRQFQVINCGNQLKAEYVAKIIATVFQDGNSVILDEFNRVSVEELQIFIKLIQELSKLKAQIPQPQTLQNKDLTVTGQFNGQQISVKASSMVIITMNPGYNGLLDPPEDLKPLVLKIDFEQPDTPLIFQSLMARSGICRNLQEILDLAPKVANLFSQSSSQLSKTDWYDFGMRAITTFMKAAELTSTYAQLESPEQVLMLTLASKFFSLLKQEDLPKFKEIMASQFPNVEEFVKTYYTKKLGLPENQEKIKAVFAEANLTFPEDLTTCSTFKKAAYLAKIQKITAGVLLIGDIQKQSEIILLGSKLSKQHTGKETILHEAYDIDSQSTEEIYNPSGNFVNTIKSAIADQSNLHWIVVLGNPDPYKMEFLNDALGDDRSLQLTSGEIINIPPSVLILFQAQDVQQSSPAFISRNIVIVEQ